MKLYHRTTGTISKGAKTLHWLAEHATKSAKYQFMKIFLDGRKRPYGKANIILKLIFVIQKGILRKKIQRGLSNKEKLRGCLTFDSECSGW